MNCEMYRGNWASRLINWSNAYNYSEYIFFFLYNIKKFENYEKIINLKFNKVIRRFVLTRINYLSLNNINASIDIPINSKTKIQFNLTICLHEII